MLTVRWFGESWGAVVCDPEMHIDTPIHRFCVECERPIRPLDQGFLLPYAHCIEELDGTLLKGAVAVSNVVYHRACMLRAMGIEPEAASGRSASACASCASRSTCPARKT